jgi:predicted GNAT superfamily acetyltransferase
VAEWHLDSPRVIDAINGLSKPVVGESVGIEMPADLEPWKQSDTDRVKRLQDRLRAEFTECFSRGYAAVGLGETPTGTAYLLAPWNDVKNEFKTDVKTK